MWQRTGWSRPSTPICGMGTNPRPDVGRLQKHLTVEPETELITAVEVSAANTNDPEQALPLLEQQVGAGLAPAEVVADHA